MDPFPLTPASFSGQARVAPPDAAFNWLRQGWASFVSDPAVPAILHAAGHVGVPQAAVLGGRYDA